MKLFRPTSQMTVPMPGVTGTRAHKASWTLSFLLIVLVAATLPLRAQPAGAIVGGTFAQAGDYPWMTYVASSSGFCGGTLIAPTWVLTAAHCFQNGTMPASGIRVWVAGGQTTNTGGVTAQALELRTEPKFGPGDGTRWDVALLRLDRVIPVAPVRLATVNDLPLVAPGRSARVLGWGLTSEGAATDDPTTPFNEAQPNTPSTQLKQADVVIGDPAFGEQYFPGIDDPHRFDPELDIIERPGAGDQHSCNGDSGGPMLVRAADGGWRQVANLSWGGCQRDDYVMSWNRLISGPHREWLDAQIHGQYGYLQSPNPGSGAVGANHNSGGPTIKNSFVRTGTGAYELRFPGLASGGGVGHVSAASGSFGRCWVSGWSPSGVDQTMGVRCATLAGAPADVPFSASYGLPLGLSKRSGAVFAQLWAERPTASSYEPVRSHVMTSNGGRPRINRLSTGRYQVELPGRPAAGVAKVSAVGGPRDCVPEGLAAESTRQLVTVRCTVPGADGSMVAVDSGFSLTFLSATGLRNSDEGTWAYLLSDRPSDPTSIPSRQQMSTGGSQQVTRTSQGRYQVRLPGLATAEGSAQVSAVAPGVHCHASSRASSGDALLDVACMKRAVTTSNVVSDQLADAPFALVFDAAPRPPRAFSDFDGDGRKDQAVFRPEDATWHGINSADGTSWWRQFGTPGDTPVPADYDGDGRTDIAVVDSTNEMNMLLWRWVSSRTGAVSASYFGKTYEIPVPGDYDGDGRADLAVFWKAESQWRYRGTLHDRYSGSLDSPENSHWVQGFDVPVQGDWDGDGRTDPAVYRHGRWYTTSSRAGTHDTTGVAWGDPGDKLTPSDFDGDGTVDHALFRPNSGTWFVTGPSLTRPFGMSTDVPVTGDYDGDRKADVAVWRPENGTWYRFNSSTGTHAVGIQFGRSGDIPIV